MWLMESGLDFCDLFSLGHRLGKSLLGSDDSNKTGLLVLQLLVRLYVVW
jgi:hypothetical protein